MVVGWDGATYNDLEKLDMDFYGGLEHKGNLLPEPYWRNREVDSGSAWTTITTGLPVEEHGIVSLDVFLTNRWLFKIVSALDRFFPRNFLRMPLNIWFRKFVLGSRQPSNDDIPFKRVWDDIENSLAFAVPFTYPPKPNNGVVVSGFPSPETTVLPTKYEPKIREWFPNEPSRFGRKGEKNDKYIQELIQLQDKICDAIIWLNREEDFEFYFIVFTLLDRIYHITEDWETITDAYKILDAQTKRLVDKINPTDVLVISDHGMKKMRRRKWVNVHDETQGIWASTYDFSLRDHLDVTPKILEYYGLKFDEHDRKYEFQPGGKQNDDKDEQMIKQRLKDLGYI